MTTYDEIRDDEMPPARARPCGSCPWRRRSVAGWLGPFTAEEWLQLAHSDLVIACHTSIEGSVDFDGSERHQCAGSGTFRANVCKLPRDHDIVHGPRDTETVFATNAEFLDHHHRRSPQ